MFRTWRPFSGPSTCTAKHYYQWWGDQSVVSDSDKWWGSLSSISANYTRWKRRRRRGGSRWNMKQKRQITEIESIKYLVQSLRLFSCSKCLPCTGYCKTPLNTHSRGRRRATRALVPLSKRLNSESNHSISFHKTIRHSWPINSSPRLAVDQDSYQNCGGGQWILMEYRKIL